MVGHGSGSAMHVLTSRARSTHSRRLATSRRPPPLTLQHRAFATLRPRSNSRRCDSSVHRCGVSATRPHGFSLRSKLDSRRVASILVRRTPGANGSRANVLPTTPITHRAGWNPLRREMRLLRAGRNPHRRPTMRLRRTARYLRGAAKVLCPTSDQRPSTHRRAAPKRTCLRSTPRPQFPVRPTFFST